MKAFPNSTITAIHSHDGPPPIGHDSPCFLVTMAPAFGHDGPCIWSQRPLYLVTIAPVSGHNGPCIWSPQPLLIDALYHKFASIPRLITQQILHILVWNQPYIDLNEFALRLWHVSHCHCCTRGTTCLCKIHTVGKIKSLLYEKITFSMMMMMMMMMMIMSPLETLETRWSIMMSMWVW